LIGVLGPAVLVSYWIGGRAAVGRLFTGVTRWRAGLGGYLVALLAMPLCTIPVSIATGTLPHDGWARIALHYLIALLVGGLSTNRWEEAAWAGFVQSRLPARYGLVLGAVATAPLFFGQHLPLVLANGGGPVGMLVISAIFIALAIFFRYAVGATLIETGGS